MWIYLLYKHLLSTCYIPDPGLSAKVTEMKDPVLLSCCTVFVSSLTEVAWDAWGTWRIVISSRDGGEKGSVRRINCGGETEGRVYFKACA